MADHPSKEYGNLAVLVVDMQNDFCHDAGIFAQQGLDVKPAQAIVPCIKEFIDKIWPYNVPIIYSRQIESISECWDNTPANLKAQFASGKLKPVCKPASWGSQLYELSPTSSEYVLSKYTYDLFSNSELKRILDERDVKTLVITGVNTDICIDTTVRRAFTEGYRIVVLRDLVATMNKQAEKHYLSVFDRFFGDVIYSKEILSYIAREENKQS